jgi:hypothetical protein
MRFMILVKATKDSEAGAVAAHVRARGFYNIAFPMGYLALAVGVAGGVVVRITGKTLVSRDEGCRRLRRHHQGLW